MDVFVKCQAVIFYYCFFNTVLQNTFSLFEQLASIRQAFGENSQLYVFCNEIWYGVISFLWSVIKLLDLVFVVEVLSLLRSDLSFGEEQYRCSQWNVYSILGFKALVEMLTLIYWHKQKRGSKFLCIKDGAHKTNGHLIEEEPNHLWTFRGFLRDFLIQNSHLTGQKTIVGRARSWLFIQLVSPVGPWSSLFSLSHRFLVWT